ncbi:hypothetical protein MMC30_002147 [Trapelia coarctata]|nr:hypothetical protein [Trapelia coarctata]
MAQGKIIHDAYASFDGYLNKRIGLSATGQSKLRLVKDTVLSALDEMQEKLQEFQSSVVNAMAFIGPVLAFEIRVKMEEISQSLGKSSDQTQSLQLLSSDYQTQLTKGMEESRESTKEEMSAIQKNIELIQKSQEKLVESLKLLTLQIDKECQQSTSVAEAEKWANLREDAEEQSDLLSDLKDTTSQSLNATSRTLGGISAVGGNNALGEASQRVGGLSQAFSAVAGLFASKKKSNSSSDSQSSDIRERPLPDSRGSGIIVRSSPTFTKSEPTAMEDGLPRPRKKPQIEIILIDQLPVPPSRTGQRPFDRSRPMPGSSPNTPSLAAVLAPPPLPPREMPGNFPIELDAEDKPPLPPRSQRRPGPPPKSKSTSVLINQPSAEPTSPETPRAYSIIPAKAQARPNPRPKPERLTTFTPPPTPGAASPSTSSVELRRGDTSPSSIAGSPPRTPPQSSSSHLSRIQSNRTRSPSGKQSLSTVTYPGTTEYTAFARATSASDSAGLNTAAPGNKADEASKSLSFAEKRKMLERKFSRNSS